MSDYQLSIVAQFDDLVRKRDVLFSGIEEVESEFVKFVWHQESCRQNWYDAAHGSSKYKNRLQQLEDENSKLETKLKHARNQIDHEIRKRTRVESDKETLESNIKVVQELLTDKNSHSMLNAHDRERLAFLSTDFQSSHYPDSPGAGLPTIEESASLLSPDISYDKTEDDLDMTYNLKKHVRASAPPVDDEPTPPSKRQKGSPEKPKRRSKRHHRRSNSASSIITSSVTVKDGHLKTRTNIDLKDSLKKYPSTGDIKLESEEETTPKSVRNARDFHTPGSGMYRSNSNKSLINRPHVFGTRTVIKPEQCVWCGKKIKFGRAAAKCRDCKATSHPECKDQVPLPCVPATVTPTGGGKALIGTITDYAPSQPPYIPALIIHCVNEVEARGFDEKGIYRLSGSEREIRDLKERFLKGRGTPNLGHVNDINVICGCLKDFLRGLKEPLLTYGLWEDFVKAAEMYDNDIGLSATYQAISELPKSNRDTIAFLIIHLQKVAECEVCAMGVTNLARVFGPTILGYSSPEPEPLTMINETRKQQMVIERLMSISRDYWEKVMDFDGDVETPKDRLISNTPEVLQSMLGTITTPGENSIDRRGTWNTPRFGSVGRSCKKKPTQFFDSPVAK